MQVTPIIAKYYTTDVHYSSESELYNDDILTKKNIIANAFSDKKHILLAMCLLSSIMYLYNKDYTTVCDNFGLNNDSYTIYNMGDILVFGIFIIDKKIIISFKGSSDIRDFCNDINFVTTDPKYNIPGKVHTGFYNILFEKDHSTQNIRCHKILELINDYQETMEIYLTGHSLGAALACIFYSYIRNIINNPIHIITFGSPRVGDYQFAKSINNSIRIVNSNDVVPKLPLPIGYRHVHTEKHIGNLRNRDGIFGASIQDHMIERYYDSLMDN